MDYTTKLSQMIKDNNGIVTTEETEKNGIPRQYLSLFVQEDRLQRAMRGIYFSSEVFEDSMYIIQTRSPKIIFSNETALYMHELSDRDPLQYSICVPRGYGTERLRESGLAVYTIKEELHEIGKETMKTIHGRDVFVYNRERTICDCIRYRKRMDINTLSTALKRYTASRQKNLSLMMEYAKTFHIEKALRHYMEVLL